MALLSSWPAKIAIFAVLLAARIGLWLWEVQAAREKSPSGWRAATRETLDSLLLTIGLVFFLVQPFVLQPFYVPSGSMENTLLYRPTYDRLLVSKWTYRLREPEAGDVVVFRPPDKARAENPQDDFIKRCMGVPGDVVYAANGNRTFYRNGKKVNEPYAKWSIVNESGVPLSYAYDMKVVGGKVYSREYSAPGQYNLWQTGGEVVPEDDQQTISDAPPEAIPPGMYLMLGDHRNNSSDGHVWGLVPRENIVGKAMCVFWPLNRVGTLDRMSAPSTSKANPVAVASAGR